MKAAPSSEGSSGPSGDVSAGSTPARAVDSIVRSGSYFTLRGLLQTGGPFLVASVAVVTLGKPDLASFVLLLSVASLAALTNPAISSVIYRFRDLTHPSDPTVSTFVVALVASCSTVTAVVAAALVGLEFALPIFLLAMFSGLSTAVSADLGRMKMNTLVAQRTSLQALLVTGVGSATLLVGRNLHAYLLFTCVVNGFFCWWLVVDCHRVTPIHLVRRVQLSEVKSVLSHVAVILAWIPLVFITSGADVFFVKAFDRERIAGYGIGVRIIAAAALPLTVAASMIPPALVRRELVRSPRLQFRHYSRIAGLAGTFSIALVSLLAPFVLSRLPIEAGAVPTPRVLAFVGLAVAIRGTWTAANLMMLQRGNHLRTLWPGSLETLVSVGVTVLAGRRWGEAGVAAGTLAGALASFAGYLFVCSRNDAIDTVGWRDVVSDLGPNILALALFGFAVVWSAPVVLPLVGGCSIYFLRKEVSALRSSVDESRQDVADRFAGQPSC